jgi:hypothetical protein
VFGGTETTLIGLKKGRSIYKKTFTAISKFPKKHYDKPKRFIESAETACYLVALALMPPFPPWGFKGKFVLKKIILT